MVNNEYLRSLDDEIIQDVYYYHNKINEFIDLYTIGCQLSEWDGEKIAKMLNTDEVKEPIIIFNTCAVTELSVLACEKVAERLVKIYPDKKIYFTGCGVDYNYDFYAKLGIAIGNKTKFNINSYGYTKKNTECNFLSNIHRHACMVKIQDGCNHNCAYCVVHKLRQSYMMPYEKIKKQIDDIISQGRDTIELVGTEITSYNNEGMALTSLCKRIVSDYRDKLNKVVLGAIDPGAKEVDELIELIKTEPKIANTLYICTQSCSDSILKAMHRRHNVARLEELNRLADGKVFFVYQLIIGFPGETDELFQETIDNLHKLKPIDFDTMPFSKRDGTEAATMPNQIPKDIIALREKKVYEELKKINKDNNYVMERALDIEEKHHMKLVNSFKPKDLSNAIVYEQDLYNLDTLLFLFKELPKYENDNRDIVIKTNFDYHKSKNDLDVNIKLLTMTFGTKIVTKVHITDDVLNYILHTHFRLLNFAYRLCTYFEFDFDKLETSSEEDVVALFKIIVDNNLDDVNKLVINMIKAGNSKYIPVLMKNFDIEL